MLVAEILEERNTEPEAPFVKTGNLGVILPTDTFFSNQPYFQECISGICEMAVVLDYNVLIATVKEHDISGMRRLVEKKQVDGVILTSAMEDDNAMQYLLGQDLLVGLTGSSEYEQIIQVDIDAEDAAETLTSFLIEEGYRRFAMVVDKLEYTVHQRRFKGFCNALEKNALDSDKQVFITDFLGKEMLENVIDSLTAKKIQCIICSDDIICAKIIAGLHAAGYRIPEDIAVASLYNSANLDYILPPVTTVNMSAKRMGNMICKQMIQCLEGKGYQDKTTVDYEILIRKSTSRFRKEK